MPATKLDKAIAIFEDETSDLSLGERVMQLGQALSWMAFERLKKINREGTKAKELAENEYKQIECQAQYKIIHSMYLAQVKMNKLTGKGEDRMNNDFLKAIKEMKSSVGSIVRDLKEDSNGEQ
jgi:hypothetical protein